MLHKTRGIVLKASNYSESSIVVQIFTEKFGLQSYLVSGAKKPKAKIRQNMFQQLQLLEMVVYHKSNGSLQRISEVKAQPVLVSIPYDLVKTSIALFINEVLYKSLKLHYEDEPLFNFIYNAIDLLDKLKEGLANFHLYFLIRLTTYLGFYPDRTYENNALFFDLKEGVYAREQPLHLYIIDQSLIEDFKKLIGSGFENIHQLRFSPNNKKALLAKILDYYQLHIESFRDVKSHLVLEDVLS